MYGKILYNDENNSRIIANKVSKYTTYRIWAPIRLDILLLFRYRYLYASSTR